MFYTLAICMSLPPVSKSTYRCIIKNIPPTYPSYKLNGDMEPYKDNINKENILS